MRMRHRIYSINANCFVFNLLLQASAVLQRLLRRRRRRCAGSRVFDRHSVCVCSGAKYRANTRSAPTANIRPLVLHDIN